VVVRYLYQANRIQPRERVFAQFVLAFALAQADPRVVGLNLVAPEDNVVAMREYAAQMRLLDFLHRQNPAVNIALHAGELTLGLVPPDGLRFHIRQAVEVGHARRIGHGVDVMYEDDPFGLLGEMAEQGVLVEINLTSNDVILGVAGNQHPFSTYLEAGVPLTLSTDDEGVSRIDLTREYQRAVESYPLHYADLKMLSRNGLAHSFLPGESLWATARDFQPVAACLNDVPSADSPSDGCRDFLQRSERAQLQWQLERDFTAFERALSQGQAIDADSDVASDAG
jgi:adenosine deaminase/adenosine deaminase CECR1